MPALGVRVWTLHAREQVGRQLAFPVLPPRERLERPKAARYRATRAVRPFARSLSRLATEFLGEPHCAVRGDATDRLQRRECSRLANHAKRVGHMSIAAAGRPHLRLELAQQFLDRPPPFGHEPLGRRVDDPFASQHRARFEFVCELLSRITIGRLGVPSPPPPVRVRPRRVVLPVSISLAALLVDDRHD